MSIFVIWIDRENAKIFQFSPEKMERINVHSGHVEHHTHAPDEIDAQKWQRKFFEEVTEKLLDPVKMLIIGPGVAKHQYQNFLNEHHPLIGKLVAGCETVDHPTDAQIAAYAKKFFAPVT